MINKTDIKKRILSLFSHTKVKISSELRDSCIKMRSVSEIIQKDNNTYKKIKLVSIIIPEIVKVINNFVKEDIVRIEKNKNIKLSDSDIDGLITAHFQSFISVWFIDKKEQCLKYKKLIEENE